MKHLKLLSGPAFAFVLLVFLNSAASAQTVTSLTGKITNGRGEPLPGLRLSLQGPTWYSADTDANGRYSFSVPSGNYRLYINNPKSYDTSVHAPPVFRLETSNFDILQNTTLDLQIPFKKLSVHVQDSQGAAVANVVMAADGGYSSNLAIGSMWPTGTLFASGNSYYAGALDGTVTNSNGDVDVWLLPTSTDPSACGDWGCGYNVTAQPPAGSQLALTSLSDVPLTQDSSVTITLQTGVSLAGRVSDGQGNPVSGLMVNLRGYYPSTGGLAITDANGRYGFSISTGWYGLTITKNWDPSRPYDAWDFNVTTDDVITGPMFEITQNMTLDFAPFKRVNVQVVDGNGQPVAGAGLAAGGGGRITEGGISFSVSSSYVYNPSVYVNSVVTDSSGYATVSLFPSSNTITVYPPAGSGLPSKSLSVNITDDTSLTVRLSTSLVLSGRIMDAEGNGLPNQNVDLDGVVSQTDSNGYYRISRDPGSYRLAIQGTVPVGSPLHASQSYYLESGWLSVTQDMWLDLKLPFQRVNVHVVDANEQPVAGAYLRTSNPGVYGVNLGDLSFWGTSFYRYDPDMRWDSFATDASGNATLWLLPTGDPLVYYDFAAFAPPEAGLDMAYLTPIFVTGETSITLRFAGALPTKVPSIASLSPAYMGAGDPSFTLVVNGTDFVKTSVIRWNGADRSTTFVSSTQLTAAITSTDVAAPGIANVTVWSPGGGESNALPFTINAVLPSATIRVYAAVHTTGTGATSGDQKAPLALSLKIFDRAAFPSSELKDYGSVWNSGPGLVSPWARITGPAVTTFSNGPANLYTVRVPATGSANNMTSGRYLIVGKVESAETYVAVATDPLAVDSVTDEYLQVVKKSDGQVVPYVATSSTRTPTAKGTPTPKPSATPKVVPPSPTLKPTRTWKPTAAPKKSPPAIYNAIPTPIAAPALTTAPQKPPTATPKTTLTPLPTKTPRLSPTPRDKPTTN